MPVTRSRSKRFSPVSVPTGMAENSGIFSKSGEGQKLDPNQAVKGGQALLEGAVSVSHKNARRQTITVKA